MAAAQEERFSRKKHDAAFPGQALAYCLAEAGIGITDIDYIVFYDKPLLKFERLLETYLAFAPRGVRSFVTSMPVWIKEKLYLKALIKKALAELGGCRQDQLPPLLFTEHHQAHAASAFFASPFQEAAVLCLDGVGEWATTSAWLGKDNSLQAQWELHFPHSLGMLYSAFTYFTGFRVNSGEYKLMGLAPYGEPLYADLIRDNLLDLKPDGTFRLNMAYFDFATGLRMVNRKFAKLFGKPPREPEAPVTQADMDLARSVQAVTEEVVLRLARSLHDDLGQENLCLAGGVALNCVANGRLLREGPYKNIWVQPASGDAGGAVGAATVVWHEYMGKGRQITEPDSMAGAYLGPEYNSDEISSYLDSVGAVYEPLNETDLPAKVAGLIDGGAVVGWFQGRMEFGPRALGNRSILGDPRNAEMQTTLNLKIKFRESFRPFAPAVLEEKANEWFNLDRPSPYMLMVDQVADLRLKDYTPEQAAKTGLARLNIPRSQIPAVTHVDNSARVQTVARHVNPRFRRLLEHFDARTGCPLLVNTSFNVRGEPIVRTPQEAFACFMNTGMDYLVLGDYLLSKGDQPEGIEIDSNQDTIESPRPDKSTLRKEGLLLGCALALIFGLLIPWLADRPLPLWPWLTGMAIAFIAWLAPPVYRPIDLVFKFVGKILGWINTRIILGALYYLLVFPMGILLRIAGKTGIALGYDSKIDSYRLTSVDRPVKDMERPF